jgi:hypothetical protein
MCIIVAGLFHRSAFFLFPLYFLYKFFLNFKYHFVVLAATFLISLFGIDRLLNILVPYIKIYAHYLATEYAQTDIPLVNKLTKYIFIPFYLLSIKARRNLAESKDIFFYNLGFFSFCMKIASLSSPLLVRFAGYFEILLIFPLFYLLIYLFKRNNRGISREKILCILCIFFVVSISLFCVKVLLLPSGEYKYRSVLSLYFSD